MNLPSHFISDVVVLVCFGLITIALMSVGLKVWDLMTRKINEEEELVKGNYAVAIVLVGFMFSIAYVIGKVVTHVLGGH